MEPLSRRDVLKGGIGVVAATAMGMSVNPASAQSAQIQKDVGDPSGNVVGAPSLRDRSLLDFGWRFHYGHANDPMKDFGFGNGGMEGFQKTGNFLAPSQTIFDDSDWKPVDLPHDWTIELPFQNDPALSSKGF